MENNEITMIAAAWRTGIERSRTNFGWYVNMQDSGYDCQALSQPKELTDCDRIGKTFSELGNAGFVLFEHTLARARTNLHFGTAAALNRRIPSNMGRHEKPRTRRCSQGYDQGCERGCHQRCNVACGNGDADGLRRRRQSCHAHVPHRYAGTFRLRDQRMRTTHRVERDARCEPA